MIATARELRTADLFRASDRCDSCGARALVLVELTSGGELQFCNHHFSRHRTALEPVSTRFEYHIEPPPPAVIPEH